MKNVGNCIVPTIFGAILCFMPFHEKPEIGLNFPVRDVILIVYNLNPIPMPGMEDTLCGGGNDFPDAGLNLRISKKAVSDPIDEHKQTTR